MSKRSPCLPFIQRPQMYNEAVRLHQQGLRNSQITKEIFTLHGIRLNHSHISYWTRGVHTPLGRVNHFVPEPSTNLAYLIGVGLSDGWRCKYKRDYLFGLEVTDYEFAEITGQILGNLLNRGEPYRPRWNNSHCRWVVKCCSILLYHFLDQPLEMMKPYIEHCTECVAAFLRAVFDGGGSMLIQPGNGKKLTFHNTNEELLYYVKHLLCRYFGIKATGPHKGGLAPGEHFRNPQDQRTYKVKKQCYYLYVPVEFLPKFHRYIGFTIRRKQQTLTKACHVRPSSLPIFAQKKGTRSIACRGNTLNIPIIHFSSPCCGGHEANFSENAGNT